MIKSLGKQLGLALTVSAGLTLALGSGDALAKRRPAPVVKVCNQSKQTYSFATMSYAGKGRWATAGWNYIRPGKCQKKMADRYYVKGAKRVGGLVTSWKRPGCVRPGSKSFRIVGPTAMHTNKRKCKAQKGKQTTFYPPNQAALKVTIWQ